MLHHLKTAEFDMGKWMDLNMMVMPGGASGPQLNSRRCWLRRLFARTNSADYISAQDCDREIWWRCARARAGQGYALRVTCECGNVSDLERRVADGGTTPAAPQPRISDCRAITEMLCLRQSARPISRLCLSTGSKATCSGEKRMCSRFLSPWNIRERDLTAASEEELGYCIRPVASSQEVVTR